MNKTYYILDCRGSDEGITVSTGNGDVLPKSKPLVAKFTGIVLCWDCIWDAILGPTNEQIM